jgi:integrase
VSKLRTGKWIASDLRKEFVSRWGKRPVTDVDRFDVLSVIEATVERGAPHQARNLLAHIRKLFNWAAARGAYGIEVNPCSLLKPADIVGKPAIRQRILADAEWRALWKATGPRPAIDRKAKAKRMDDEPLGFPFGGLLRVLALTGARRDEIASARWSEIDFDKKLLRLAPERMKADAAHVIPLTESVIEIFKDLPQLGEYVFTASGKRPVSGFSKMKRQLDTAMLEELRRGAERPEKIELAEWRLHDLRRPMRTGLSALGVQDRIAELAIGHKVQGLHKVYDQHSFLDERRDALIRWERHLLGIVEPRPSNIVELHGRDAQHG